MDSKLQGYTTKQAQIKKKKKGIHLLKTIISQNLFYLTSIYRRKSYMSDDMVFPKKLKQGGYLSSLDLNLDRSNRVTGEQTQFSVNSSLPSNT